MDQPTNALVLIIKGGTFGEGHLPAGDYLHRWGNIFELREGSASSARVIAELDDRTELKPFTPPLLTWTGWYYNDRTSHRSRGDTKRTASDFVTEVLQVDPDKIKPPRLADEIEKEEQASRLLEGSNHKGLHAQNRLDLALPLIGVLEDASKAESLARAFLRFREAPAVLRNFTGGVNADQRRVGRINSGVLGLAERDNWEEWLRLSRAGCEALLPFMRLRGPYEQSAVAHLLGPDGSLARECRQRFDVTPIVAAKG